MKSKDLYQWDEYKGYRDNEEWIQSKIMNNFLKSVANIYSCQKEDNQEEQ